MTRTQRWTLAVVCAATAMLMLDIAVVNTALSAIATDLDTGLSGLQWVVDAYTLALAATVITAGSLADRFGRRRLFLIGLGLFIATSMLCAAAQSITMLNASRAAQGLGAAVMFAVSLAVLSNAFPRMEERVKALAAYGATMGGSFAVGPLVGGALTSGLDWRWIFLINVPLGLGCLWIVHRFVAESMDPRAPRTDRPGLVTLTGGLFLLVFALLRGNEAGWGSTTILASFGGAAALLCAFVAVEARVAHPMLPLRFFRNPSFTGAQVGAFGISASLFAMWLYMTLYLQQILGLSAIEAGLVYLPGTILNFLVAGATASVGQKVSPRVLIAAGLALIGAGQALLTIVEADSSWWLFLPGPARRDGRHGDVQPGRQPGRAELGAARAERPRRGRQRHVPPGRDRRRRRRAGRARARRRGVRRGLAAVLRRRHAGRPVGRRRARDGGRRRHRAAHPLAASRRGARAGGGRPRDDLSRHAGSSRRPMRSCSRASGLRRPPVPAAEQRHQRRHEQAADDERVDQHAGRGRHADLLDERDRRGDEGADRHREQDGRGGDHRAGALDPDRDRLALRSSRPSAPP